MEKIESKNLDSKFKYDVAAHPGGENIKLCFACGTCTAGCPVSAVDPEYNPRKIIRQVLLGMRKEVLSSPVIWRCVQCYSCTAKCPQNVKFRNIIKALREIAVAEGYADLESVRGQPGHFTVTINKRPRYVDPEKCTGCGRGWIERPQQKRW